MPKITDPIHHDDENVNAAMRAWLAANANPKPIDVIAAVTAGFLKLSTNPAYRYTATVLGREWLLENALNNGATMVEAHRSLDHIDGAAL